MKQNQPKVRLRDLPGVQLVEENAMIAEKFRESLPQHDVDDLSRALFGTTADELVYEVPQWFADGFSSQAEWDAARVANDDENDDDDYSGYQWFEPVDSPERQAVRDAIDDFKTQIARDEVFRDDYERMDYAAALGIDFADHSGNHPLHLTRYLFHQAVAAVRGVKGHLPDVCELGVKEWSDRLADEAKRFKSKAR